MNTRRTNSWNAVSANRITNERTERGRHEKHLHALQTIRGAVDHYTPADQPHLRSKPKTKKLQEDRAAEIQLENRILLQKMLNIDTKPSAISGETLMNKRVRPRSMHAGAQRRELDRITRSNQDMLKRLQNASPSVDPRTWEVQEEDRQALKFRISQNACRARPTSLRMPPRTGMGPSRSQLGDAVGEFDRFADDDLDRQVREFEMQGHDYPPPPQTAPAALYGPGATSGSPEQDREG